MAWRADQHEPLDPAAERRQMLLFYAFALIAGPLTLFTVLWTLWAGASAAWRWVAGG